MPARNSLLAVLCLYSWNALAQVGADAPQTPPVTLDSLQIVPVPAPGTRFGLQIGIYPDRNQAEQQQAKLSEAARNFLIIEALTGTGARVQVLVLGDFASEFDARVWKTRLLSEYNQDSRVIQLPQT